MLVHPPLHFTSRLPPLRQTPHAHPIGLFAKLRVVGYQGFDQTVAGEKILVGATFQKIDNSKVTLGDLGANDNFLPQTDVLTILNAIGGVKGQYVYIDEQLASEVRDCGFEDFTKGWYENTEWGNWDWESLPVPTCYDSTELEKGEAVMLQPGTTKGGLVFNGQVANEDTEVKGAIAGDKAFRCNCSPVEISLGQILPNEIFLPQTDVLTLINAIGGVKGQYVYIDEQLASEVRDCGFEDFTKGWYENAEWGNWDWETPPVPTCYNESITFKAGEGFLLQPGTANGGLIIPSAL